MDIYGKIVSVNSPEKPSGANYLYKGPMNKDETGAMSFRTENLAPGTYFLRVESKNCVNGGRGNQLSKFVITD